MLWLTGGSLVVCVVMIVGFLAWIAAQGFPTFWPGSVVRVTTHDSRTYLGEIARSESYQLEGSMVASLPESIRPAADEVVAKGGEAERELIRTGNFELFETHFEWVADFEIAKVEHPEWALVIERLEWGRFYGFPDACAFLTPVSGDDEASRRAQVADRLSEMEPAPDATAAVLVERRVDGRTHKDFVSLADVKPDDHVVAAAEVWSGPENAWRHFQSRHDEVRAIWEETRALREDEIGAVNDRMEAARLRLRQAELDTHPNPAWLAAHEELAKARASGDEGAQQAAQRRLQAIEQDFGKPPASYLAVMDAVEREDRAARQQLRAISDRIEALEAEMNRDVLRCTTVRPGYDEILPLADIVRAFPANQLSFGDKVSIYLSRWAEFLLDDPREANSEGGVFPAIFGTVLMTLIMCLVVLPFGVLAALYLREYAKAGPIISLVRIAVNNLAGVPSIVFGVFGLGFFCYIVGASIDDVFFSARLPQPTFGTGGLMWASMTLALMTAPVVIVATEEALSAVPNSMREGSYACGASKWQTIRRIVLPRALPGIMTGAILAMARGAGEVAPLMLVGAVKLAPELPFDTAPPFGLNRSFMHLGFHIYDLGFQSQNSEAAKPMVYTTTLVLILIVALLNVSAIALRSRLRRRFVVSHF